MPPEGPPGQAGQTGPPTWSPIRCAAHPAWQVAAPGGQAAPRAPGMRRPATAWICAATGPRARRTLAARRRLLREGPHEHRRANPQQAQRAIRAESGTTNAAVPHGDFTDQLTGANVAARRCLVVTVARSRARPGSWYRVVVEAEGLPMRSRRPPRAVHPRQSET